jgi:hypothetical protein
LSREDYFINIDQQFFDVFFLCRDDHFRRETASESTAVLRDHQRLVSKKHSSNFNEKIDHFEA